MDASTLPVRPGVPATTVAAVAVSLVIGAAGGSLVTRAVADDTPAGAATVQVSPGAWDPQKLEAIGHKQLAEGERLATTSG